MNNIIYNISGAAIRLTTGSLTYTTNCIYSGTIVGTPTDGGGNITGDPLFVDLVTYNLKSNSPCVGVGTKWWGSGPRPVCYNGEPKPDTAVDIGFQSTHNQLHPRNL